MCCLTLTRSDQPCVQVCWFWHWPVPSLSEDGGSCFPLPQVRVNLDNCGVQGRSGDQHLLLLLLEKPVLLKRQIKSKSRTVSLSHTVLFSSSSSFAMWLIKGGNSRETIWANRAQYLIWMMTVKMSYPASVAEWPTPAAQPSVHHGPATMSWCAQSHSRGVALTAAFEEICSGERMSVCVFACRQWGNEPGRSSCSERGSFSFWQKVWILRQSLSPPPKAPACSLSHAGIWLLPSLLSCREVLPGFGKGEEALAWCLAPSWAGRECAQVSRVLWVSQPCGRTQCHGAPRFPWECEHLLGSLNPFPSGQGWCLLSCSQQPLAKRCRSCPGAELEGNAWAQAESASQPLETGSEGMREPVRALQTGGKTFSV